MAGSSFRCAFSRGRRTTTSKAVATAHAPLNRKVTASWVPDMGCADLAWKLAALLPKEGNGSPTYPGAQCTPPGAIYPNSDVVDSSGRCVYPGAR
jgi:hypothetical protein